MKYLLTITVGLLVSFCKTQKATVQDLVENHCIQHPIAFYLAEKDSATDYYQFGKRDKEFRELVNNLRERYRVNGSDISGRERSALVRSFVPNYVSKCQKFFESSIDQNCSELSVNSEEFQRCIKPINRNFQEQLQENIRLSGTNRLNLEDVDLKTWSPSSIDSKQLD